MKMQMIADFRLYRRDDAGLYQLISIDDLDGISPGGFTFEVDGKSIPFDFNAQSTCEEDGVFHYESGYGPFLNDFEIPEGCWEEDYEQAGLTREEISPKLLASATKIEEFFISLIPADEGEDVEVFQEPDAEYIVELLAISFEERDTGRSYDVDESVLVRFNENNFATV